MTRGAHTARAKGRIFRAYLMRSRTPAAPSLAGRHPAASLPDVGEPQFGPGLPFPAKFPSRKHHLPLTSNPIRTPMAFSVISPSLTSAVDYRARETLALPAADSGGRAHPSAPTGRPCLPRGEVGPALRVLWSIPRKTPHQGWGDEGGDQREATRDLVGSQQRDLFTNPCPLHTLPHVYESGWRIRLFLL